jgi:hypothetical protein
MCQLLHSMMQAQPNEDLEQEYNNLTEKQRAIIDAHAENPDATNREKAQKAAETLGEDINESYCSQVINNRYPELAHYRADIVQNQRSEGEQRTTGDPYPDLDADRSWQTITECERQASSDAAASDGKQDSVDDETAMRRASARAAPVRVDTDADTVTIELNRQYVQALLQARALPPELHDRVLDAVFDEAFDD